jgi:hypothetical protein
VPQYNGIMVRHGKGDSLRNPPQATITTTDRAKFMAWVDRMESMGYVEVDDHDEMLSMLANVTRANELERNGVLVTMRKGKKVIARREYDPAKVANRPSGLGQKPFPKPTRDYKGSEMPKGPWTGEKTSMSKGPSTPQPTTKRFPHLGGQTGPQSRGE